MRVCRGAASFNVFGEILRRVIKIFTNAHLAFSAPELAVSTVQILANLTDTAGQNVLPLSVSTIMADGPHPPFCGGVLYVGQNIVALRFENHRELRAVL